MQFNPKATFVVAALLVLLGGAGGFVMLSRGSGNERLLDPPGWEPGPFDPRTMICRSAGILDWIVETGSAERPGSGAAMNVGGFRLLNKLFVRFLEDGADGEGTALPYEPEGEGAVEGRTRRELKLPAVSIRGLRVFRRIFVSNDGSARWLDIFVNERPVEIVFQAILENEGPLEGGRLSRASNVASAASGWIVTPPSGGAPWLAHVGRGAGHTLEAYSSGEAWRPTETDGRPALRPYRAYEIRLDPGAAASVLSFVEAAATEREAADRGWRIFLNPSGRLAWLSPREKRSVRNFILDAAPASDSPSVRLNTPSAAICWGDSPVQVEAWDDTAVVRMELTYWEDWDLPQGHSYYEHDLYADETTGRRILYNICWDTENSPRHSGGFWKLEGTAWDAEGNSGAFLTLPFVIPKVCSDTCRSSIVVLESDANPSIDLIHPLNDQTVWGNTAVQVEARAPDGVARIQLFLDGRLIAEWTPPSFPTQFGGTYAWDTLGLEFHSLHTLRAEVIDRRNRTASTTIRAKVSCVQAVLEGRSVISTRIRFVSLDLSVSNPDAVPVSSFILLRKTGSGVFQPVRNVPAAGLSNGRYRTVDGPLRKTESYAYRIEALTADGQVVGRSSDLAF